MDRKRIAIAGTNVAGYTAALELKELVGDNHDIIAIANTHAFLFFPSLIWYPFGLREEEDVTFDVRPIYESHGIEFVEREIERFDPPANRILTKQHEPIEYDYLLIGTGPKVDYDYIPGLREHSQSIVGLGPARRTRAAWEAFVKDRQHGDDYRRRSHAEPPRARVHHPGARGALGQGGVREVLPVDAPARARVRRRLRWPRAVGPPFSGRMAAARGMVRAARESR
jgi:NADPH-dependent 2,4-dienoyl-CoA reductase/sulfur reductase-like enzyme